jgi:hypothetical protein
MDPEREEPTVPDPEVPPEVMAAAMKAAEAVIAEGLSAHAAPPPPQAAVDAEAVKASLERMRQFNVAPPVVGDVLHLNVQDCHGCGGAHPRLPFVSFQRPRTGWIRWAVCPTTGEPMFLRVGGGTHQAPAREMAARPDPIRAEEAAVIAAAKALRPQVTASSDRGTLDAFNAAIDALERAESGEVTVRAC